MIMDFTQQPAKKVIWMLKLGYVPLKHPKREAAHAASPAGDIENMSSDASVYSKYSTFQIISAVTQKLKFMLWILIQYLVPQVKAIRDKKVRHKEALELLKRLCKQMLSMPQTEASRMFRYSIITAAKHGISEIVEVILEMYPDAIYAIDKATDLGLFHMAVKYRHENVFNLFYRLSDIKYEKIAECDNERNNILHLCGKLAPPDRLNRLRGAALQMQQELQWYKEMEKHIHPSRQTYLNRQRKTPKMLFTEEHQNLKDAGEKWMKDTANACTIATALISTVVFTAAFTVPGGIKAETGYPLLSNEFAFILFAISNAVSFFTSITSLLMFLSILTSRYAEEDFLYVLPKRLSIGLLSLFMSIIFMMFAFSATLYLVFHRKVLWFFIPAVAALACLPVTSFVLLQFPLLIDVLYSTYGPGLFGKKGAPLMY